MFGKRLTDDLVQVINAGAALDIQCGQRLTADLVRVATAAATKGAKVTFRGLGGRMTADLVQIAAAGRGAVTFAD
jgi:hypothetical protein